MVAAFVLLILASNLAVLALIFLLVSWILSFISGWGRLAAMYRCTPAVQVEPMRRETLGVGVGRYYRCAKIAFPPEGLYLAVAVLRCHPPLCIPWREFKHFEEVQYYKMRSVRLTVGAPEQGSILLPMQLYCQAYPYLIRENAAARRFA